MRKAADALAPARSISLEEANPEKLQRSLQDQVLDQPAMLHFRTKHAEHAALAVSERRTIQEALQAFRPCETSNVGI